MTARGRTQCRLRRRRAALFVAAVLVLGVPSLGGVASAASVLVSGGGSAFAEPAIQQWASDVAQPPHDLTVNYQFNSSAAGRLYYATGLYQYGVTDNIYYPQDQGELSEATQQHPFDYVPITAGGLAFMYDIVIDGQRWTGLNLTRQDVCQIFTGQLTNWDQLAGTEGDSVLAGVNESITAATRSDEAGESYALSKFCQAVDPADWATFQNFVDSNSQLESDLGWNGDIGMAAGTPIENWPAALEDEQTQNSMRASGATEELNDITDPNNGGSIGYLPMVYADFTGYPVASVQNGAGDFVQPNATSVNVGLTYATPNSPGTFDVDFNGSDPAAYFPATYSYVIAPTTTNAPASAGADATLAQFLCYAVGQGQQEAAKELYAPLSAQITAIAVQAIEHIPGAPPADTCGVGGSAPAPQLPEFPDPALALLVAVGVPLAWRRRRSAHLWS
jgi:MYXO-CTERM domain-containing protein